jgi:hypothetical protein
VDYLIPRTSRLAKYKEWWHWGSVMNWYYYENLCSKMRTLAPINDSACQSKPSLPLPSNRTFWWRPCGRTKFTFVSGRSIIISAKSAPSHNQKRMNGMNALSWDLHHPVYPNSCNLVLRREFGRQSWQLAATIRWLRLPSFPALAFAGFVPDRQNVRDRPCIN